MPNYTVHPLGSPGQPLSEEMGIPQLFVDFVNRWWLGREDQAVLAAVLPDLSDDAWVDLGIHLVGELLSLGASVGLCLDGACPLHTVLSWSEAMAAGRVIGGVEMKWLSTASPNDNRPRTENVSFCVLQTSEETAWLESIWRDTEPSLFHYGCDLILAVYQADVAPSVRWEDPLTIDTFGLSLQRATGWMLPLDVGFILGLPAGSEVRQRLESSAGP